MRTEFLFDGFFAFRTPLLPFDELVRWGADLEAPAAMGDPAALAAALERDRRRLRDRLRRSFASTTMREALFVASPSLDDSFDVWMADPDGERGQKAERSLVRYFARMCARPTPFGLFAGFSLGGAGPAARLALDGRASYRRHTRLDMEYVCKAVEDLLQRPELRRELIWRPSSSLYEAAGQLRFAEQVLRERARSYHLVAVSHSEHIAAALACAANGASARDIVEAIERFDPDLEPGAADGFVAELIDAQLLVADLVPAVTGPEPVGELVRTLRAHPSTADVAETLSWTLERIEALDGNGIENGPAPYREVAARLEQTGSKVDLPRLFQVDMVKPATEAALGTEVIAAMTELAHLLHRIAPPRSTDALASFRDAFVKRYESRAVPLVEALDEEMGIGFGAADAPAADPSPLLAELPFPARPRDEGARLGRGEKRLLARLGAALRAGAKEVVLDEDDLNALASDSALPLPDCFALFATLVAPSPQALAAGDFRIYSRSCSGPSGASLLGRFCHADAQLEEHVRAHLRREEALRPDAIFAEVVHLPEGRVGNVIARPTLRDYEIPFLGRSGAPQERQILVSDLTVSVVDGRIVLRSRRLGREVIPRLTNAHNYQGPGLAIYRFLCTVARQGTTPWLAFEWRGIEAPFLPRVSTGRFVLSRARWKLTGPQLATLAAPTPAAQHRAMQELRSALELPRFVYLVDGDNHLPVDLDNALAVDSFVQLVKQRDSATLEELFPGPHELCASGPEGLFAHELIVPFHRAARAAAAEPQRQRPVQLVQSPTRVARRFPPGSEWLYWKIYCGAGTADRVLREVIVPLLPAIADVADRWFFIRYADPDPHLRLRFHGSPERLQARLLPAIAGAVEPLLQDGRVWRTQLDTYERELERYGGAEGILPCEEIFFADSMAVAGIVDLLDGDDGLRARWQLGLRGMDLLLDDLGFDLPAKHALSRRLRAGFAKELKVDGLFERKLGEKFRKERAALEDLFDPSQEASHPYRSGIELLRRRSASLAPSVARLRKKEAQHGLTTPVAELAGSLLHMHANRILRSSARAHELVMYDFLGRLYESQAARARGRGARTSAVQR